jgi:hypothetical protein
MYTLCGFTPNYKLLFISDFSIRLYTGEPITSVTLNVSVVLKYLILNQYVNIFIAIDVI